MNVGQILETHLGWAAHALGVKFAAPDFDGATEKDIKAQLKSANLPSWVKFSWLMEFRARRSNSR